MMSRDELSDYFEQVAAANARLAIASPGDLRLAINAIVTLYCFSRSRHDEHYQRGLTQEKWDDAWKQLLAQQHPKYRLLRDCAYAVKHGHLTRPIPRLVRRPNQIVTMPSSYDASVY